MALVATIAGTIPLTYHATKEAIGLRRAIYDCQERLELFSASPVQISLTKTPVEEQTPVANPQDRERGNPPDVRRPDPPQSRPE